MDCGEVREALSALLDSETPPVTAEVARRHLAGCADCRQWQLRAEQVTRQVRVGAAADVPDLTARVLAAVNADRAASGAGRSGGRPAAARWPGWRTALRIAVALAAVLQLGLALPELLFGAAGELHTHREGASFDVAIAVGFLLAARYPERARALMPVAAVLAVALALTTGIDLANGATTVLHEVGHALVILQAGLLWALGRTGRPAVLDAGRTAVV
ncbi:MAG: zf-HC2 domain-containing protein [Micromonosporaceae bacterium]